MHKSIYGRILADMLAELPDANCATLADWEGETIDRAGVLRDTQMKLVGAHWGVVYDLARTSFEKLNAGVLNEVAVRLTEEQIIVRRLDDYCYVVLSTKPTMELSKATRALDSIHERLIEAL